MSLDIPTIIKEIKDSIAAMDEGLIPENYQKGGYPALYEEYLKATRAYKIEALLSAYEIERKTKDKFIQIIKQPRK